MLALLLAFDESWIDTWEHVGVALLMAKGEDEIAILLQSGRYEEVCKRGIEKDIPEAKFFGCHTYATSLLHEGLFNETVKYYGYALEGIKGISLSIEEVPYAYLNTRGDTVFFSIKKSDIPELKIFWRGNVYNQLGLAYMLHEDPQTALKHFQKALKLYEKVLGEYHYYVGDVYDNMGVVYRRKGDYDKAISYHKKALRIYFKSIRDSLPNAGMAYDNLGTAYMMKGDYERAIESYKKALRIYLKVLGPEHPYVADVYNNLGNAYRYKGDYDRAIEHYHKALKIYLKTLGPENPYVAYVYENLSKAYEKKGDKKKAEEYRRKAEEIRKRLGED